MKTIVLLYLSIVSVIAKQKCGPLSALGSWSDQQLQDTSSRVFTTTKECVASPVADVLPVRHGCRVKHEAYNVLDCCCSTGADSKRQMEFMFNENPTCSVSRIKISVNDDVPCEETLQCCKSCRCFGDPHCESFPDNFKQVEPVRESFVVCDIRDIPEKSDEDGVNCGASSGRKISTSKMHRKRCLGLKPGYEFNANRCVWQPDVVPGYNFDEHGGPCHLAATNDMGTMLMAENDDVKFFLETSNRGVIIQLRIVYSDSTVLTLDSQKSCYHFCTTDECLKVSNSGSFVFKNLEFEANGLMVQDVEVDRFWSIKDLNTGNTAMVKCIGGTHEVSRFAAAETEKPSGSPFTIEPTEPAVKEYLIKETGSYSYRAQHLTRLDVGITDRSFVTTGTDSYHSGFCASGSFQEKTEIFEAVGGEDPFKKCGQTSRFEARDFPFFLNNKECKELLEENNCGNFDPLTARGNYYKKERKNFHKLLDRCAELLCESFQYKPSSDHQYVAPRGTDKYRCKYDLLDFGARFTNELYGNTYTSDENQDICNPEVIVLIDGEVWELDDNGNIEYTIEDDEIPRNITVVQTTCAGDCSGSARVEANVQYFTMCEDILSLVSQEDATLTVGDREIDLSRFVDEE